VALTGARRACGRFSTRGAGSIPTGSVLSVQRSYEARASAAFAVYGAPPMRVRVYVDVRSTSP
jgi:hypothetical protein